MGGCNTIATKHETYGLSCRKAVSEHAIVSLFL